MTLFLASVRDAAEAETALAAGADIIDLKNPDEGALGAVEAADARAVLRTVGGRAPTSATIGDLPMRPEPLFEAVMRRTSLGVDYVKVGLFPDGDPQGSLVALAVAAIRVRLVVVLFADRLPAFDAVAQSAAMGAAGIMLDTAGKGSGSLLRHLPLAEVGNFVARGRSHGLGVGLAGSLKTDDVDALLPLAPDILGFRGALCRGARTEAVDLRAARAIRSLIPSDKAAFGKRPSQDINSRAAEALC